MSDASQGPGWWQASDGKWYPPEQAPGATPTTPPVGAAPGAPVPGQPQGGFGAPTPGGFGQPAGDGRASFSVGDAFNWGFKKFQENLGPILIAALVLVAAIVAIEAVIYYALIGALSSVTHTVVNPTTGSIAVRSSGGGLTLFVFGYGIAMLVFWIGYYIIQMAVIRATMMISNDEQITLNGMFSTERLAPFIGAAVLVSIGTYVGMMLCIIPGIIFMFFSFFFGWFVIDKKMGAFDSIKASWMLVNQNMGSVVGFFAGCIGIYVVASILFYIGNFVNFAVAAILMGVAMIVAIPVIVLTTGYVYKRLQGEEVAPAV